MRDTYGDFTRKFFEGLFTVFDTSKEKYLFNAQKISGNWIAETRKANPEYVYPSSLPDTRVQEFQRLWLDVRRKAIDRAEMWLSPLVLVRNKEEMKAIQKHTEILTFVGSYFVLKHWDNLKQPTS